MKERRDTRTRNEVTDTVDKGQEEMKERAEDLEQVSSDVETVRRTLDELDLAGTTEGADQVTESIHEAEEVTKEEFDRQDNELEQVEEQSHEFESELQEGRDSTYTDLGKISDAGAQIKTDQTQNELNEAKAMAQADIEFLQEHVKRASESREESTSTRQRLEAIIRS